MKKNLKASVIFGLNLLMTAAQANPIFLEVKPAGFRLESYELSLINNDETPNILSHVSWNRLRIFEHALGLHIPLENIALHADLRVGRILDGSFLDSDYDGNNRTLEFSRATSNISGNCYALSAHIELPKKLDNKNTVSFLVGYDFDQSSYDGKNLVSHIPNKGLIYQGDVTSFRTQLHGPWVGLKHQIELNKKWSFYSQVKAHLKLLYANADWKLRNDFKHPKSFENYGAGWGLSGMIGLTYQASDKSSFFAEIDAQQSIIRGGSDIVHKTYGTFQNTYNVDTKKKSLGLRLGFKFRF